MDRETVISELKKERLVLLSRCIPTEKLCRALTVCALNGIRFYESTFDHTAEDPIHENVQKMQNLQKTLGNKLCIGAGTVLTKEEVRAAYDCGCSFIVSPDADEEVVSETLKLGMVSLPGAMTPTEVKRAWKLGADMVKLFPADDLGYHYIQNLRGPLGHIPLMATGGVNPVTIPEFFRRGIAVVGTGVTVFKPELLRTEDYEAIGTLARMHVDAVRLYEKESEK